MWRPLTKPKKTQKIREREGLMEGDRNENKEREIKRKREKLKERERN